MKKRMHSHKYANIKDMQQLHLERARLHIQLDMKEQDLQQDYQQVKSMFSVSYLISSISNGIGGLGGYSPILSSITTGYSLISDMISKRSKKRKAKQRRAICEADE